MTGFGLDESVVTRIVGVQPSAIAISGSSSGTAAPRLKKAWILESPKRARGNINGQLEALANLLQAHESGIRRIAEQFQTKVTIHIDDRELTKSENDPMWRSGMFKLSPSGVGGIARLGIPIEFHINCGLSDDDYVNDG